MQGRRIQQINNLVITEINSNSYILWSPDDKILDASRNMNELIHEASTCKSFTAKGSRKSVLVDVDSTLADFHHALQRLLGDYGYNYIPENLTDYHGSPANQIGVDWGICFQKL